MKFRSHGVFAILLLCAAASAAEPDTLESRVQRLEQSLAAPGKKADPGEIELWFDRGLRFESRDGSLAGRLGAYVITQSAFYPRLRESDKQNTFGLREAGIEFGARFAGSFEVFISPDFRTTGTRLLYGWAEFNRWDNLKLRVGQFKEPFSLETLEETKWWDFLENSVVYMHAPVPELGAMVYGAVPFFPKIAKYFIGVFNGNTASLATAKGADENSDKDIAARFQVDVPGFPAGPCNSMPGYFHAAASFTQGRQRRDAPATPFPMFDPSTGTFFQANPGTTAFRTLDLTRVNFEAALMIGPVELKGEYSIHRSKVAFGEDKELFTSQGYFGQAGFWLAGSRKPLGVPQVDHPLFDGGTGAVQVAGRVAELRMDDDFERRAGFLGARRVREWCAVVNWFPNPSVRVSLQYAFVEYSHGEVVLPSGRAITKEDVLLFRVQVAF